MAADSPNDSAGTALAVGDTVNLVGVIESMNLLDPHYNDVVVTLSHPIVGTGQPNTQDYSAADKFGPGARIKIACKASMLTKV